MLAVRVADLQQLKTALQTEIETLEAALQCMRRKIDEHDVLRFRFDYHNGAAVPPNTVLISMG